MGNTNSWNSFKAAICKNFNLQNISAIYGIWLCLMHVHIINIENTILKKSVNFNSCVSLSPVAPAGCGETAPGDHASGL